MALAKKNCHHPPETHDALRGIDTEAVEQVFHIAAAWLGSQDEAL